MLIVSQQLFENSRTYMSVIFPGRAALIKNFLSNGTVAAAVCNEADDGGQLISATKQELERYLNARNGISDLLHTAEVIDTVGPDDEEIFGLTNLDDKPLGQLILRHQTGIWDISNPANYHTNMY